MFHYNDDKLSYLMNLTKKSTSELDALGFSASTNLEK